MEFFFLITGILGIFLTTGLVLARKKVRPQGRVEKFGVHFTPNTVFTSDEVSKAIEAFCDSWLTAYPHHKKGLKKALQKLNIIWHTRRIKFQEGHVMALMEQTDTVHLWIGPRLKDGNRNLAYTGLLDQLGKLALITHSLEPNTDKPEVRKILADARTRMFSIHP